MYVRANTSHATTTKLQQQLLLLQLTVRCGLLPMSIICTALRPVLRLAEVGRGDHVDHLGRGAHALQLLGDAALRGWQRVGREESLIEHRSNIQISDIGIHVSSTHLHFVSSSGRAESADGVDDAGIHERRRRLAEHLLQGREVLYMVDGHTNAQSYDATGIWKIDSPP